MTESRRDFRPVQLCEVVWPGNGLALKLPCTSATSVMRLRNCGCMARLAQPFCSISHAPGLALLAWQDGGPVGVDIQAVNEGMSRLELRAVAQIFLALNAAQALDAIAQDALFFKAFASAEAQEARLKCAGVGLMGVERQTRNPGMPTLHTCDTGGWLCRRCCMASAFRRCRSLNPAAALWVNAQNRLMVFACMRSSAFCRVRAAFPLQQAPRKRLPIFRLGSPSDSSLKHYWKPSICGNQAGQLRE